MIEEELTPAERMLIIALLDKSGPNDCERHELVESVLRKIDGVDIVIVAKRGAECPVSGARHHWVYGTGPCLYCHKPKPQERP